MSRDYTGPLWLLKLGAPLNLYFLLDTPADGDPLIVVPARIFFAVSAFRCLFPVRYEHNVVFHDTIFSSIFLTRLLATFAEVAYIFQFSHVLRVLDTSHAPLVAALSWFMVVQVVVSQGFAWAAVVRGRLVLFFYEELGWALVFAANTLASAYLFLQVTASQSTLVALNLLFGAAYLPWQVVHLRKLWADRERGSTEDASDGLIRSILVRNRRTDAESWGGLVGLSWMTGYWVAFTPAWVFAVVILLSQRPAV